MFLGCQFLNFRKQIDDSYKSYRKSIRKPVCYKALRTWIEKTYPCKSYPNLEADDTIGILATGEYKDKCVIILCTLRTNRRTAEEAGRLL